MTALLPKILIMNIYAVRLFYLNFEFFKSRVSLKDFLRA